MDDYLDEIRKLIEDGRTHEDISLLLSSRHPGERGYSRRSVRRFCAMHGIRSRSGLTESELDDLLSSTVRSAGNSYGRKTMHGLLRWRGLRVGQNRISRSLTRVAPRAMRMRQHMAHRQLNPVPYRASYFGEKLHIDQNEKLNLFGVTHIIAVDG